MRAARNSSDHAGAELGWLDWLRDAGVPAISGVDTRALVLHIREAGSMRGGIFPADCAEHDAAALIEAEPSMVNLDLAREVTPERAFDLPAADGVTPGPTVALIDTGIKRSIADQLRGRGVALQIHPCGAGAEAILARSPDALMLVNGPGDPAALDYIVGTVRELVGRLPIFGICLGHQLLCRAVGLETYKLRFGHRGANHPVKDLETGRIEITSQNHGFAVLGPGGERTIDGDRPVRWDTDFGAAELTHLNLYDRTVEGLRLPQARASTVQYHPEAGPGPHDALHLFDRFLTQIRG
jgi:carbamoyl-phosphate synthase small subunit